MLDNPSLAKDVMRRLCLFVTLVPIAAALVSACIVSPVFTQISADVTYSASALPDILNYTNRLLDIIFAAAQYASIIVSFILFPDLASRRAVRLICIGATLTRCLLNLVVSAISDGGGFVSGIPVTLLFAALELVQHYVAVFIVSLICGEATKRFSLLRSASRRIGSEEFDWVREVYPYRHPFSKSNPVQKSGLLISVIFSALLVISRLIYDFSYGAPESSSEIIQMVVGYTADIASGILAYGFILLFSVLFFKGLKAEAKPKRERTANCS